MTTRPNCDVAWTETFSDAKGEEINIRYGILIQEAEGLNAKHINYDREIWESAVSNYMSQVKIASEQERYRNVDAIVIEDDYVEPNYFALSNLGQFIENQLDVAIMA